MSQAETVAPADSPRIADVLARAFGDDPLWSWLLPDGATRSAKLTRFFGSFLAFTHSGRGQVWSTADRAGAAVWLLPGRWKLGLYDQARLAPAMLAVFGTAIARTMRLMHALETAHPAEPHHYLFFIGTDPGKRGQGVGAALMTPMLARCDADGLPAYLESSNPRNLGFYRRHGFADLREVRVAGSPPLTLMRRPPRPRQGQGGAPDDSAREASDGSRAHRR
jgi:ribosomal protein S18 acetylase RimI-like enzyme